ncbi:MAG: hypothetical protein K8F91_22100, partial [Candidatus Obscuribacterales bacterium]|nr:hypothetical protein [Candidatus Obscuribacterales bacterium]
MRKTRAYFFAWLAIVALAVSLSPDCFAFKSGYIYEKIHENIIRQALDSTGIVAKSLQTVINGADSQDDIKSKKFTDSPTHHFDDCLLNESIAYFQDRFSKAVGY